MKKLSEYSVKEILAEDPYTLVTLFSQEYDFEIPEMIDSVDDLKKCWYNHWKISKCLLIFSTIICLCKNRCKKCKEK